MDPMLVVDEDGVVRGVNPAARDLLGRGTGQRCWDVVGGLWGDRRPACVEGCATRLRNLPKLRADHGVVRIRGVDHELVCVAVGDQVVVQMTPDDRPEPVLTTRQQQVLRLVARGCSNTDIALELGIGVGTIRTHVENARAKLEARTRAQAVALAIKRGEID